MIRAVRATMAEERFQPYFSMDVYDLRSDRGAWAEKRFPFGAERHGFAVVDAVGDMVACRPGHNYGAAQITQELQRIQSEGSAYPRTVPRK